MSELPSPMFVSQATLEAWLESERADMDGRSVTVRATGERFDLEPAVRFVETIPDPAPSRLLGQVAPERAVVAAGGELLGDSVLFGDAGFTVEPGYIARRAPSARGAPF
jgi:hypothetical protein